MTKFFCFSELKDLDSISRSTAFSLSNPGLLHEFQFIDVGDLEGDGETTPMPYFYQNLAEAEYCVHLYMYMRLCG